MTDIVERLRFDATRCEMQFSKGVATNIEEGAAEIGRLRTALTEIHDETLRNQRNWQTVQNVAERATRALEQGAPK